MAFSSAAFRAPARLFSVRPSVARVPVVRSRAMSTTQQRSFYDFEVKDIDGQTIKLDKFKGKVCLVVNLASACGFTSQYTDLQALQTKYEDRGFTVIGFPCNQFGSQEPGTNSEIKQFASSKYNVTFPLMSKVNVNGAEADPVFTFLKSQKGGLLGDGIKWNFSKFLVDKEGNVVGRYASITNPSSIAGDIEKHL